MDLNEYLKECGYEFEENNFNLADFVVDITAEKSMKELMKLSKEFNGKNDVEMKNISVVENLENFNSFDDELLESNHLESPTTLEDLSNRFLNSSFNKHSITNVSNIPLETSSPPDFDSSTIQTIQSKKLKSNFKSIIYLIYFQFWILNQRNFKNLIRNFNLLLTHLFLGILFSLILIGGFKGGMSYDETGLIQRFGLMSFILLLLGFTSLSAIDVSLFFIIY